MQIFLKVFVKLPRKSGWTYFQEELTLKIKTNFIQKLTNNLIYLFRLVVFSSSTAFLTVTLKRGVRPQIASIDYNEY